MSKPESKKTKTSGDFQVQVQNELATVAVAGDGSSVDNTMDVTTVNQAVDAKDFGEAVAELAKRANDIIPDGAKAYNVHIVEVKTGKKIQVRKETTSCAAALKEIAADLKNEKLKPETPAEGAAREARIAAGKKA